MYRAARTSDGKRILVDRLWPRGVAKGRARLFSWCKDIAPSDALRQWFHANPNQWQEFSTRYMTEIGKQDALIRELAGFAQDGVVTLLYASKDEDHNNAVVLQDYLRSWFEQNRDEHDDIDA